MLKLDSVSFYQRLHHQNQYPILQNITFQVNTSDRLAIVGNSGSGKTSLLRLLNRLNEPTSGKIYLENQEYQKIPVMELRRQIILVQQEAKLLGMRVKDALSYPLALRSLSITDIEERINYWCELLKIPDQWLTRHELELSTGEKQLIAIARALVTQPKILLLDEPTTSLDTNTHNHLINALTALNNQHSTTIFIATHDLDFIQQFCDHLLHLEGGQLATNQTVDHINWENVRETLKKAKYETEWV
ncbi:ATP-binding cassette domain-containing protein [Anabaena sp. FACHB-1237]|uniref:ABC transporter ATP-binding protein n=1 Tax=Anabaena sp. FACHB-1237 TaxID=2692769 RepID=UPI001680184E|nr:ATP-binding cassette domain-containing protein [Anabaena sp. FACHB-1237]MBD2136038.1 ATP-binding cassette domain-containing protein [Anabaena sp. FACHB-1237]